MNTQTNPSIQTQFSGIQQCVLLVLFAGFMSIAFLDYDVFYIAWIAFVPLLFAIENASLKRNYCIGSIAGFLLFALATYWIPGYIVTAKGLSNSLSLLVASLVWLFSGQLIAITVVIFTWLKSSTRLHEFILFPVVVTTTAAAFPMLFAMHLAESQVNNLYALQAIEFFGVHGLDALIALFNIVVFRFLYNLFKKDSSASNSKPGEKRSWLIALSVIALWFAYGLNTYNSWDQETDNWQTIKVGLVQPNEIPTLGETIRYPEYSRAYTPEMEMTKRLKELNAELVIWPEAQNKNYTNNAHIKKAYSQSIKDLQISLLFQDKQDISKNEYSRQKYNMAIMLDEQGNEQGTYRKIRRIPFGEYLPFLQQNAFLQSKVQKLLGKSDNELIAGESHQLFKQASVNIIPLICYETTYSGFVANAVNETTDLANKANGTILVGLSNDGWFKSLQQSKQHIFASSLRAVENRLPLVHAVNNGPSIVVLPNGKRIFESEYQESGGYLIDVPYPETVDGSFYSRHPKLFLYLLYSVFGIFVVLAFRNTIKKRNRAA